MKQLKTVLVGLGRIGYCFHLPRLTSHPGFDLVGVVDVNEARLNECDVQGFSDLQTCLDAVHPDLVVIASPTHLHLEHTLSCLRAGADVFLDKPMTTNASDARTIRDTAAALGRKVMVYQPHRVTDEFNTVKAILESGKLGRVYQISRNVHAYTRRADWQAFRKFGGGMLQNYGAHYIDQLLALTGAKVTDRFCFTDSVATLGDADDVVECLLKTDLGILLRISINHATAHAYSPWVIYGEFGTAHFDVTTRTFPVKYLDPALLPEAHASESLAAENRQYSLGEVLPWQEETVSLLPEVEYYDHCYDYFCKGLSPFVTIDESVTLMELIDSLRS